ncbi:acyl-[ACP]--phospholipid O-acyltransferase [Methylovirgula sp. 4M-Z18]|uniref:acyl-[ACP]--phospholipid O-acyltransferase n=1 Tax=Methylovirgula sp. 4M-Z18 TaxID=2293567 RepID=UPI000E2F2414|nr:acyl-[ACP]--phospholipid O-acyltransferase [Methylovirgula sp. 4M-Z18]RFB78429.1 acyl-[ACP]--phospholipid O-acyltransferase [Methylovirgula sp. 4M-Z18]
MFASLMSSRRFAPLFWCQFLSAFNDNFVRYMLAMLLLFRVGEEQSGSLITLALAVFMVPTICLSGLGGEWADAHDKSLLIRRLKFAEIFVQMIAAAGFVTGWLPLFYVALLGLGTISALFGPIKYGILPDHLKFSELPAGNALIEGATFLAIICGIIAGSYAASTGRSAYNIVAQLMIVALSCWLTARLIPSTPARAPDLKVRGNLAASTFSLIRELRADPRLWTGALGMSWFWMLGAVVMSLVPVLIKSHIGGGIQVEAAINLIFAVGIALGSLLAALLCNGRVLLLPVPIAAILMALFLLDIGTTTIGMAHATQEISVLTFLASSKGMHISLDIALLAASGGLFAVPLNTAIQEWAHEDHRARVIAGVNVINALFMAGGAVLTAVLQRPEVGFSEPALLIGLGVLTIGAGAWLFRALPGNFVGDFANLLFRICFRLEVKGLENVERAGEHVVIALNHTSFLDAPVILSILDEKPVFAIDWQIAKAWWVKPFLRVARVYPMDPTKPLSTRGLIQEVKQGHHLVIFPEGRLTVTGALMKIYDGAAMIADKSDAMVVPVRLDGLERTFFSRLTAAQIRRSLFPKVRVTFLEPRKLAMDQTLFGRARRQAAGAALYDIMSDLMFATSNRERTLMQGLKASVKLHGGGTIMLQDPIGGTLSANKVLIGAAVLGRKIMGFSQPGEIIGLMLPNANGAAVTFFALQAAGRVPAMLNYTAGANNLISACKAAGAKSVLTSRAFIEKANLGKVIDLLAKEVTIVWLEDLRASVTTYDKLRGMMDKGRAFVARQPSDPAVVLFTSGSEGTPKGVVLSHSNLTSNIAQVAARFDITAQDIAFNALPIFHSLGLTGGLLLPMLTGMKSYLYPSPLHYRAIPELVYGINATVLFGTDTFLMGYARTANPYDFRSIRYIIAGAEPVKAETRRVYMEKFGLRILEGYGVTETAPVLAVNTPMFNRIGSVGRLMPGVEHRLEEVPGIAEGGRLHVRGPNVMLGYYRAENPGVLDATPDGWHDTGDIVTVDGQKFVTIKGRAKRFAKIAGEMVSLSAVEQMLSGLWPDSLSAVVAVPDARKGERLILVTTKAGASRAEALAQLKAKGATELMAPSEVMSVTAIPLLGTGKTDYVELNKMVRATVEAQPKISEVQEA